MRVWCKPCTRVVWCRWTSASICCELRGSARIWGWEEGDSLLLPQDTWLSPHLWFPWLLPGDSSSASAPGVPSHQGCFPPRRAAHCQGNLFRKENKQMPARWQCATCEELGLASHLP